MTLTKTYGIIAEDRKIYKNKKTNKKYWHGTLHSIYICMQAPETYTKTT